ncbi:MAG: hypothetical protein AB7F40_12310 [Victivallaceae bacterium]
MVSSLLMVVVLFLAGNGSKQGVFPVLGKDFGTVMEIEGVLTDKPLGHPDQLNRQTRRMEVLYVDNIKLELPIGIELLLFPGFVAPKSGTLIRLIGYETVIFDKVFYVLKVLPESRHRKENNTETIITKSQVEVSAWERLLKLYSCGMPIEPHGIFPLLGDRFYTGMTVQGKLINHNSPGSKAEAYNIPNYSIEVSKVNGAALDVKINIPLEHLDLNPAVPTGSEATLVGVEVPYQEGSVKTDIEDADKVTIQMIIREEDFAIENIFHVQKIENISLPCQN